MEGSSPTLQTTTIITNTIDNLLAGSSPSHTETVTDITTMDPLSSSGETTQNLGDVTTTDWTFHQQISKELNMKEVPRSSGAVFKSANGEQVDAKEDTSTVEAKQEEINVTLLPDIARIFNGQYHEVNPGQYHEVNPGQDVTAHPGDEYEDYDTQLDTIQVDMDQDLEEDTRIYNIKVKVDMDQDLEEDT